MALNKPADHPQKWFDLFVIFFLFGHSSFYWTCLIVRTHHIKITSIVTDVNVLSFSDYDTMVFMPSLKTYTVSGYFNTPVVMEVLYYHHLSTCHLTTILRPKHWWGVSRIRRMTGPRYLQSEVFQLPVFLTTLDHQLSRYM